MITYSLDHQWRLESIHTFLLRVWIDSIKGYGSTQDVIDASWRSTLYFYLLGTTSFLSPLNVLTFAISWHNFYGTPITWKLLLILVKSNWSDSKIKQICHRWIIAVWSQIIVDFIQKYSNMTFISRNLE